MQEFALKREQEPANATEAQTLRKRDPESTPEKEISCQNGEVGSRDGGLVVVRFVASCTDTKPGEELKAAGSASPLGAWDAEASSVVLRTTPEEFPLWRSDWVHLPQGQLGCEFKYVICRPGGRQSWEAGANRLLSIKDASVSGAVQRLVALGEYGNVGSTQIQKEPEPPAPLPRRGVQTWTPLGKPRTNVRNIASFCTLSQAFGPAGVGGMQIVRNASWRHGNQQDEDIRRRATFGCLAELPEGLVPTRRALGLQDESELVREAACTELGGVAAQVAGAQDCLSVVFTSDEEAASSEDASSRDSNNKPEVATKQFSTAELPPNQGLDDFIERQTSPRTPVSRRASKQRAKSFENEYDLKEQLGEGAFGVVFRCVLRAKSSEDHAVKIVKKDRLARHSLIALLGDKSSGREGEVDLHGCLPHHNNIVGLHDCFQTPSSVRLVMDLCKGGDLFDAIRRAKMESRRRDRDGALTEPAAANVVRQVLLALVFCHSKGVVHRDVKAENVLIEQPIDEVPLSSKAAVVKICDFGLAARCWAGDGPVLRDPVGSPDYLAPEVARLELYGQVVDVWSAGVLLFACLRGRLPFPARTDQEVLEMVRAGRCVFDNGWAQVTTEARTFTDFLL
eukprot:CAMPEP_0172886638 /NCGR_PEP_ID=MMETSP1075-20121228/131584_1 /TAXON_ID=2916 /ORGANISM="Ceratium fusus, Strain PA161109" /LENGTH=622 /DNA_ID=CAMNT_0013740165 /DNA_START=374 /DNA_END=2239 /DNA_ORIENTATION=+